MFLYYIGMITLYYWIEAPLPLAKRALSLDGRNEQAQSACHWMEALFPLPKRAFPVKERMIGINYD